jgi:transglutaminase-like putative cysteine protease
MDQSAGEAPANVTAPAPMQPPPKSAEPGAFERYTVLHETCYAYTAPVSQSWQLARLTPRRLPWQRLVSHALQIDPVPDERHDTTDSFGNAVTHFGLHGAHRSLRVAMRCEVDVAPRPRPAGRSIAWELVREASRLPGAAGELMPARMSEATPLVPLSEPARQYGQASLRPGRSWLEAVKELMHRIHAEFEFEPGATTVSTRVEEVLERRHGVCQDFAHVMLACLRGHGLPARYVSGYLLTDPPPGLPRLMGVDATHAWVAAWAPECGWVEFDPTNDQCADTRYITLAWGSDFADVVPLRGVILGGGTQDMDVSVSVFPRESAG